MDFLCVFSQLEMFVPIIVLYNLSQNKDIILFPLVCLLFWTVNTLQTSMFCPSCILRLCSPYAFVEQKNKSTTEYVQRLYTNCFVTSFLFQILASCNPVLPNREQGC